MDISNGYRYYIAINREIDSLPALDRRLPPGDYFILQINRHSPPPALVREFRREQFLHDVQNVIRYTLLFSTRILLPPNELNRFAQRIGTFASNAAQRHDFAASRLLPINVSIFRYRSNICRSNIDHRFDRALGLAIRKSVRKYRTIHAAKLSIKSLEEVDTTSLACEQGCVICLEELSPYKSVEGRDRDDDGDKYMYDVEDNDKYMYDVDDDGDGDGEGEGDTYMHDVDDDDDDGDTHMYDAEDDENYKNDKQPPKVLKLPCSHFFHKVCIIKWLQTNHFCPLCRYGYAMPTS